MAANSSNDDKKPKFIIDNDAGGDDAMAIFLGLLYEKYFDGPKLVALTTANGNTKEDNVYHNNQKVLKVANRQDVPIYRGSKESIVTTPKVSDYYGVDGLGDTGETFPDLVPAQTEGAVNALINYSKLYEGNLTVITIGALTNVALAIKLDPNFLSRLSHLYIGAGHIHSEKYPLPEFNAHMDVEAYHIVVKNATPDKVTIFPFSQTKEYLSFSKCKSVQLWVRRYAETGDIENCQAGPKPKANSLARHYDIVARHKADSFFNAHCSNGTRCFHANNKEAPALWFKVQEATQKDITAHNAPGTAIKFCQKFYKF